jgi:hypothetical protein
MLFFVSMYKTDSEEKGTKDKIYCHK